MALFLGRTLYRNLGWAVFQPNDETLWLAVARRWKPSCSRCSARAFQVKCDASTTTRLRWPVHEEWGSAGSVVGRGMTAMFARPSGTGKTMAAQALARSLWLTLYRVDLAGVVNKHIGETEKRLNRPGSLRQR